MNALLQKKIKEAGELLAGSMLAKDIKEAIRTSASDLSMEAVDALLDALKKEKKYLEDCEKAIKEFQALSDKRWASVSSDQEAEVSAWVEGAAGELEAAA